MKHENLSRAGTADLLHALIGLEPRLLLANAPIVVANLNESGPGSLAAAILQANSQSGADTIRFDGLAGPILLSGSLPAVNDQTGGVTIDGTTSLGYAPGVPTVTIQRVGAPGSSLGLPVTAGNTVLRGLGFSGFGTAVDFETPNGAPGFAPINGNNWINGNVFSSNTVALKIANQFNNVIGTNADGVGDAAEANQFNGINSTCVQMLNNTDGSVIAGNYFQVTPASTSAGTGSWGVELAGATNVTVGGLTPASRNYFGILNHGIEAHNNLTGSVVEGNWFMVFPNGGQVQAGGNFNYGVWLTDQTNLKIGGTDAGAGNVFANLDAAIWQGSSGGEFTNSGVVIQGNLFGTKPDGTLGGYGNNSALVFGAGVGNTGGALVGGTTPGAGNVIAGSKNAGIEIFTDTMSSHIAIEGNSIHDNGGLGIRYNLSPTIANDAGDTDTVQNFPELSAAVTGGPDGNTVTVSGTLDSKPSTTYLVELFGSDAGDGSGFGEGQSPLVHFTVTTDGSGHGSFSPSFLLPPFSSSHVITALATDQTTGSTSQFSAYVTGTDTANTLPRADGSKVSLDEDTSGSVTLSGADKETLSANLKYTVTDLPVNGTLYNAGTPVFAGQTFNSPPPVLTYIPGPNYNGSDIVKFTVTDDGKPSGNTANPLTSDKATIAITVRPVNDTPSIGASTSITINEDNTANVTLSGHDIETPDSALIFTITAAPAHGVLKNGSMVLHTGDTVTGSPANLIYVPTANYNGPDSVSYTVTDTGDPAGVGTSPAITTGPSTVSLTVTPVNDNPTAAPDSATTSQNIPVSIELLGNDTDVDNDPALNQGGAPHQTITLVSITQPSFGSVVVNPDGHSVTYTPANNFAGNDSFTYQISDGNGGTATGTVSVRVLGPVFLDADPADPSKQALFIYGTNGDDHIHVNPVKGTPLLNVNINGKNLGNYLPDPGASVYIFGLDGNDSIDIGTGLQYLVEAHGDAGNDKIKGGNGPEILIGGDGKDNITAGGGRDFIVGGNGADTLQGGGADDLIIAGATAYDNNSAALHAILNEWLSGNSYTDRVNHLRFGGGLNGPYTLNSSSVFEDGSVDAIDSGAGLDLVFANTSGGGVLDHVKNAETVVDT